MYREILGCFARPPAAWARGERELKGGREEGMRDRSAGRDNDRDDAPRKRRRGPVGGRRTAGTGLGAKGARAKKTYKRKMN